MNQKSKWIIAILTLLLTASYQVSFGKKVELKLDSEGRLSPPAEPTVHYLGNVEWVIEDRRIQSFIIEAKDTNKIYIFDEPLPTTARTSLKMKVRRWSEYDWGYNIYWINAAGIKTRVDPKIPVKPGIGFLNAFLFIGFIVATISSIIFQRKWRKANETLVANGLPPSH